MVAITALFGALALFWLSTRQFALIWRALIWLAGAGLLAWAAFFQPPTAEFGLWPALQDAWAHRENLNDAAIVHALANNGVTVAQFIPQLLDFFLVAGAIMGALALFAFSRGERLERALRPVILALFGFIAGSTATLAVVAIGLGGQVKPRTFIGQVASTTDNDENSVHDGDTFWLGEVSLRLWGVDAPELSQDCRGEPECAEMSRAQLESFLIGKLVQCDQRRSIRSGRLVESFGRPLVQCWRIDGAERIDVGAWMISNGYAVRYEYASEDYYPEIEGAGAGQNFRLGCALRPDIWRRDRAMRARFEAGQEVPQENLMGDCSGRQVTQ